MRKHKRKAEHGVDIALPITPMLDMSFQLLSFFILTFTPTPIEGQMSINLPKVDTNESAQNTEMLPPDKDKDEYTITVISDRGEIGNLSIKGPTGGPSLEGNNLIAALYEHLQAIVPPSSGRAGQTITIEASPDLNYSRLIEVMDVCKKAKFESINLAPIPKKKDPPKQ